MGYDRRGIPCKADLGHLARIHRQLDLELVLQRLAELKADPLVKAGAEDALDDIRFYLKFQ
jgi:hypothetical protein